MNCDIHVGTSGYSFKDWIGTVYEPKTKPSDFLSNYARLFDSVEINTTYYRVPHPTLFANMLKKVPSSFIFVVKLPKEITHDRKKSAAIISPFKHALEPLIEENQLGALLAQFPYSFKPSVQSTDYIKYIARLFHRFQAPINIEFRHSEWYKDSTYTMLRDLKLGIVNVDLPPLPGLPRPSNVLTSDTAYYRFHGRNAKMWWKHPTASHRYDYQYSEEQLGGWVKRIEDISSRSMTTYVFTNNCHLGQSVVNALQLHRKLGLPKPILPPRLAPDMFESSSGDKILRIKARIAEKKAQGL